MSLSAWEQQALDSIRDGLADSDPGLAALMAAFTRLESGEEMPAGEEIPAGSRRAARRPRCNGRHVRRVCRHLGFRRAALLLWLLVTAGLVAVAVMLSGGASTGTCTESWAAICSHAAPARGSSHATQEWITAERRQPLRREACARFHVAVRLRTIRISGIPANCAVIENTTMAVRETLNSAPITMLPATHAVP
jgi:hypothetical protein